MRFNTILSYGFCGALCVIISLIMLSCSITVSSWLWGIVAVILLVFSIVAHILLARAEINENTVKFCMLDSDAMMPEKRYEDAGYDIYG